MNAFIGIVLLLTTVILLARFGSSLGERWGIPPSAVQLGVGVMVGPSLLDVLRAPIVLGTWGSPSPTAWHGVLKVLSEVGLIQLMFLAGLRVDARKWKNATEQVLSLGFWVFGLAFVSIALLGRWFLDRSAEAMALGAVLGGTGFGTSVYNAAQMKRPRPELANTISGAAALTGGLSILTMIGSHTLSYGVRFGAFEALVAVSWFLGKLILFFAVSYFLMSRFLRRIGANGFEKRPRQTGIGYLLLVAALYGWGATHFGSFAGVVVSSLGGGLLGMGCVEMRDKVLRGSESVMASLPVGLLFITMGMEANLRVITDQGILVLAMLGGVVFAKSVAVRVWARKVGGSSEERTQVTLGAFSPGEMGMLVAAYFFSRGLLPPPAFNVAVTVVVLLAMLVPLFMRTRPVFSTDEKGTVRETIQLEMKAR